ncbi:MAG: serine protease Do [Bacteroidota bacterium]|nr:serine protease Do [Bacteroidota bacterium]
MAVKVSLQIFFAYYNIFRTTLHIINKFFFQNYKFFCLKIVIYYMKNAIIKNNTAGKMNYRAIFGIRLIYSLLLFTLTAYGCNAQDNGNKLYTEAPARSEAADEANSSIQTSRHNAITKTVEICSSAVVGINVTEVRKVEYRDPFADPFFRFFFGDRNAPRRYQEYSVQSLGSGFIISPDGYILTNHHVAGNASKIIITMTSGEKYDADIIGSDEVSDVALLKIRGSNFPYLKLSNSDNAIIGEWVISFGNPFGLFDNNAKPTVTVGVVSNKGIDFVQDKRIYRSMIQTDAAISSGNSGGPLVNALGEVIGMNTIIFSTAQSNQGAGSIGIGFAIPINRVKKIVDILKEDKSVNRNFDIGLNVSEIDEATARYYGLKKKDGVIITSIQRNSPVDKIGMEPGDIILEINNKKILRNDDVYIAIFDCIVGDTLNFVILRQDKKINKTLYLKSSGR